MNNFRYISFLLFIFIALNSYSQDTTKIGMPDTTDFSTMSLEDLIKLKSTYKSTELEEEFAVIPNSILEYIPFVPC